MRRSCIPIACAAILALASCSTAPKKSAEVLLHKNQAAEYSKLADGFLSKRDYASALRFYQESLRENQGVDNREGVVVSMNSVGRVYLAAGKTEDAEASFRETLGYADSLGNPGLKALTLANLGEALYSRGNSEEALRLFQEGIPLASRDEKTLAVLLHNRAVVYRDQERWYEAEADLRRAAGINQRLKRLSEYGANYYLLANVASKRGDPADALDLLRTALAADKTAENSPGIAADLEALAVLSRKKDLPREAFDYYRRAFDVFVSLDSARDALRCARMLAELAKELSLSDDETRYSRYADRIKTAAESAQ